MLPGWDLKCQVSSPSQFLRVSYINSSERRGKKEIRKDIKESWGLSEKPGSECSKSAKITDFVDTCVQTDSSKVEISFLIHKLKLICLIRANAARGRAGLSPACHPQWVPKQPKAFRALSVSITSTQGGDLAPNPHPKARSAPRLQQIPGFCEPGLQIHLCRLQHMKLP